MITVNNKDILYSNKEDGYSLSIFFAIVFTSIFLMLLLTVLITAPPHFLAQYSSSPVSVFCVPLSLKEKKKAF